MGRVLPTGCIAKYWQAGGSLSEKLLKNRRERRENKARGGEQPECTRGYMRIVSRRATPLSQAQ